MYQDCVSPHQAPLARELVTMVGADNFRYVYRDKAQSERVGLGWTMDGAAKWFVHIGTNAGEAKSLVEDADCLLTMFRDVELIKRRHAKGLKTFVQTERWFKPKVGILRMLSPSYRCMAKEFVRLMDNGDVVYLPIGIHAARDMARLCGLMHGDWRCLFCAPRLEFERKPGGKIWVSERVKECRRGGLSKKYCLDNMRMWGYFVEKGKGNSPTPPLPHSPTPPLSPSPTLRVLWVGRFLNLKRVDTIIRAVGKLSTCSTCSTRLNISLDIYGTGPEENQLKKMAAKYGDAIKFYPPVSIDEVRKLMHEHDVYVMASNAYEGWGAVVSEALEEGMNVIGTYEAGASTTMLPDARLFRSGDYKALATLLTMECNSKLPLCLVGDWTAAKAVESLLELY